MADNITPQQQLAVRGAFREEMEFATGPLLVTSRMNYESAMKFAETAIKGGFLLNGGGLVAVPAFVALVRVKESVSLAPLTWALVIFALGVLFAWLTSIFGYFSARRGEASAMAEYEGTRLNYTLVWNQSPQTPPTQAEISSEAEKAKRYWGLAQTLTKVAVGCGIASVLGFLIGACISAHFLLTQAGAI